MTPVLAFILLLVGTVAWVLLPLMPALREMLWPTDAEPLQGVGRDAGDMPAFAESFRQYLERELPRGRSLGDLTFHGREHLRDGTPLTWLNGRVDELWDGAPDRQTVSDVVVTSTPTELSAGATFLHEIYARDRLAGGPGAVYRAFLAERDARLGGGSHVARWAHSEGDLFVDDGVTFHGRASTKGTMWLGDDVRFQRINASRVVVGGSNGNGTNGNRTNGTSNGDGHAPGRGSGTNGNGHAAANDGGADSSVAPAAPWTPARIRFNGAFELAAGETFDGTLIVRGPVHIGDGAQVRGSLKAHGTCHVGVGAKVLGSLVAVGDVVIGQYAHVDGPVISERDVEIAAHATVGSADARSSVVGDHVTLCAGAQVFGLVSARRGAVTRCTTENVAR